MSNLFLTIWPLFFLPRLAQTAKPSESSTIR